MCRYQSNNQNTRSNQTNPQIREISQSVAITATNQNQQVQIQAIPATTLVTIDELRFILAQTEEFDQNSSTTTTLQDDWSLSSSSISDSTTEPNQ